MELEDFITTTLLSIKKGIRNANVKIAEDDGGSLVLTKQDNTKLIETIKKE